MSSQKRAKIYSTKGYGAEKSAEEKSTVETPGKHMSREKQRVLLVVTLIACALPMLMGLRLWDLIPETVSTDLFGVSGTENSLSRTMVAVGMPCLLCALDLVSHFTLQWNQKHKTMKSAASLVVSRWGFPILSVIFCSGMILEAVGQTLTLPFLIPCAVGLALLLLGSHVWDCKRDTVVALHISYVESSDAVWKSTHRFAGWLWTIAGLVIIAWAELAGSISWVSMVLVIVALCLPVAYAKKQASKLN